MTKKQQLYYLLEAFQNGEYDVPTFCTSYEDIFYPDIPYDELTKFELDEFQSLGDIVARFSPYEEDLKLYPEIYHNAETIKGEIQKTYASLLNKPLSSE